MRNYFGYNLHCYFILKICCVVICCIRKDLFSHAIGWIPCSRSAYR